MIHIIGGWVKNPKNMIQDILDYFENQYEKDFDFVIAIESYYFWPEMVSDLIEIKRVLKPGGFLLLVHAAYKDDQFEKRNNKLVNLLDIKIHTPDEYKDFLSEAEYQMVKINSLPEKNWITVVAQKSES